MQQLFLFKIYTCSWKTMISEHWTCSLHSGTTEKFLKTNYFLKFSLVEQCIFSMEVLGFVAHPFFNKTLTGLIYILSFCTSITSFSSIFSNILSATKSSSFIDSFLIILLFVLSYYHLLIIPSFPFPSISIHSLSSPPPPHLPISYHSFKAKPEQSNSFKCTRLNRPQ